MENALPRLCYVSPRQCDVLLLICYCAMKLRLGALRTASGGRAEERE